MRGNELVNERGVSPEHPIRRRFPRYSVDKPLVVSLPYWDMPVTIRARCKQLGEGGAGAETAQQFSTGEVVCLKLSATLTVYAAVRYSRGFYHGFEFVLLRDRQKSELKRMCSRYAPARTATAS
jgi:PilZ domain